MIRYGFIRTKEEIKFLVLYCMKHLTFPVSYNTIVDLCTWCDDGFSYFELTDAFKELISTNHLEELENEHYQITAKGLNASEIFEDNLPFTAKEAAQKSALRVMRQIRRDADIKTSVSQNEAGELVTHLCMENVFALDMSVADRDQSSMLEKNFKKHAEKIYAVILDAVTRDYDSEQ